MSTCYIKKHNQVSWICTPSNSHDEDRQQAEHAKNMGHKQILDNTQISTSQNASLHTSIVQSWRAVPKTKSPEQTQANHFMLWQAPLASIWAPYSLCDSFPTTQVTIMMFHASQLKPPTTTTKQSHHQKSNPRRIEGIIRLFWMISQWDYINSNFTVNWMFHITGSALSLKIKNIEFPISLIFSQRQTTYQTSHFKWL